MTFEFAADDNFIICSHEMLNLIFPEIERDFTSCNEHHLKSAAADIFKLFCLFERSNKAITWVKVQNFQNPEL